jgi:hypothetical protein
LVIALQALCFGGKLQIEEAVFDSHSASTTQTIRCKLPRITGAVKDMTTVFTFNQTYIPNAKITYQPIEINNKPTDIRNRKIYSDPEGLFKLCSLSFNKSDICKYLVIAKSPGYGLAKEIIEFPGLDIYPNTGYRNEYFAFDISLGLWPKWTKQKHKAYIQGVLYLRYYADEGYEDYKTLSDVEIKVKGLKTKYKASVVSESGGEFETDYLKADTYILTTTYNNKTYRKKVVLPKSTTYNYKWIVEQE